MNLVTRCNAFPTLNPPPRPCTILAKDCDEAIAKMPSPQNTSLLQTELNSVIRALADNLVQTLSMAAYRG